MHHAKPYEQAKANVRNACAQREARIAQLEAEISVCSDTHVDMMFEATLLRKQIAELEAKLANERKAVLSAKNAMTVFVRDSKDTAVVYISNQWLLNLPYVVGEKSSEVFVTGDTAEGGE